MLIRVLTLLNKSAFASQPHSSAKATLRLSILALIFGLSAFLIQPSPVRAAGPWYVSTAGTDSASCGSAVTPCRHLGYVIQNKASAGETINVVSGTYLENLPNLSQIIFGLTIVGEGATSTIIDGGGTGSLFHIVTGTVTISNMTIQNGKAAPSGPQGGGVWNENDGLTTLISVTLKSNTANTGGGIYNAGTMALTNVTVVSNSVPSFNPGGGIFNIDVMSLTNVTISGNTAGQGGGIENDSPGNMSLTNVTMSGNSATLSGGGLYIGGGSVSLTNTIIANSTSGSNCAGAAIATSTNNIKTDATCGSTGFTQYTVAALKLGPLASNAPGTTQTHALLYGSPAINAGTNTGCPSTDQRGITRPVGSACDIGAYEFNQTNIYFLPLIRR